MAEPHTDTDHDSGTALAITLIGLFVVLAIFASPWVFSDAWWNNTWRQEQVPMGLPVEEPKAGLPVEPPQARLPTADEDAARQQRPATLRVCPGHAHLPQRAGHAQSVKFVCCTVITTATQR